MDYFYAQLDQDGVCMGISQLAGEVEAAHMIAIEDFDIGLLGRVYEDGQWSEKPVQTQGIDNIANKPNESGAL